MNRNQLKYIAAFAMLLDHIAMVFSDRMTENYWYFTIYCIMRALGRLTAPIMCWFLAQGFIHTSSKKKYALRLFIFALISQIPYTLIHHHTILNFTDLNVIFMFLLSFVMLCVIESSWKPVLKWIVAICIILLSAFCDWGVYGPILVLCFYFLKDKRKLLILIYCILSAFVVSTNLVFMIMKDFAWYSEIWQLGLFLFIPLLFIYNGEKGSDNAFHKWFFYIFYPVHLLILSFF